MVSQRNERRAPKPDALIDDADLVHRFASVQKSVSVEAARSLALAVARGWWNAAGAATVAVQPWGIRDLPVPVGELPSALAGDAEALGGKLARLSVIDASAALGRLYTACLPQQLRSDHGVYYTPAPLVGLLLDRAEEAGHEWTHGRIVDPSCGGGAFLVQAALRTMACLKDADPAVALKAVASRIVGWDLDPFAAWLAQVSLDVATLPLAKAAGRRLPVVAVARDALRDFGDAEGRFDLVVGNPPFGKVKDNERIRSTFSRSLYGHPNLYGLFTDLAVRLAKAKGGRIAYLTPASFLAGHYFKNLRQLLAAESPAISIDFIASRRDVFEDVLQEVVLSTFQRERKSREVRCRSVLVGRDGLHVSRTGTVALARGDGPWILPRRAEDAALVAAAGSMTARLADWGYKVSTGPLVWNRHKPRLHNKGGKGRVPVIWAEAVQRDGRFTAQAIRRAHAGWFEPRPNDASMLVERPCVLVQRTTAKEQHRRLISAALPAAVIQKHGQVTVENHLNMVLATSSEPRVPAEAVARFLGSGVADRLFRCINASVAVSASELEAMPLPSANDLLEALSARDPEAALSRLYGETA